MRSKSLRLMLKTTSRLIFAATLAILANAANASSCNDPSAFPAWIEAIKREAAAQGISPRGIAAIRRSHGAAAAFARHADDEASCGLTRAN